MEIARENLHAFVALTGTTLLREVLYNSLKKPKTNFMKKSITYSAASVWNDLPKCAKEKGIEI